MKYEAHQVGAKKWSRDWGSRKKKGSEQRWEGPGWRDPLSGFVSCDECLPADQES